jgi:hypothetical protein
MIRHSERLARTINKLDALESKEGNEEAIKDIKGELEEMKQMIAEKQAKKATKK